MVTPGGQVRSEARYDTPAPTITPLPRPGSLFDLTSVAGGEREESRSPDLPPSYSQAEGLDQLPRYSQVRVDRVDLGPYVVVLDRNQRNVLTFKKVE